MDTPHLYRLPNFFPPDNYIEKIITLKDGYKKGYWQEENNEIILNPNHNIAIFPKETLEIYYQNSKYYLISDEELKAELTILLDTAINHYLIQHQLKESRPVNPEGSGIGIVFKNFDKKTKIILS